jgi:hypothetical protein
MAKSKSGIYEPREKLENRIDGLTNPLRRRALVRGPHI